MNVCSGRILAIVLALATSPRCQELDSALFRDKAIPGRSTLLDEIADPRERSAFLKLYEARDPEKRYAEASAFLEHYPQSWLLAEVLEADSKACIDLGKYDEAIKLGVQSLRLFPENPLLLVPLANVEAQQGQLADARKNARDALEYLEQFDRPAAVPLERWPTVQNQLRASADYALGRADIAAALTETDARKQRSLLRAVESLRRARGFNPADPEIPYLLGLTEMALGRETNAASYFAEAQRRDGPFREKALDHLRQIYAAEKPSTSFEEFLASGKIEPAERTPVPAVSGNHYAGSQSCQPCHAEIYLAWRRIGMGRMLRKYEPENVIGDFLVNNRFSDPHGAPLARMTVSHGKYYFTLRDSNGNWTTYPVDYTIGSKWQQAYATRLPDGDIHVFPIQYNALIRRWVNYWKMIDPPGSPRIEVTAFSQLSSATSYQLNCAPCHTSQLRLTRAGSSLGHDFEFREAGINCEMCHGGGQEHILAMRAGKGSAGRAVIVDFRTIPAGRYVAICAQCHAQSALRQAGPNGEINYPPPNAPFPPAYLSRPYTDISRRAFYRDGRFRETTFIVEALRRSACFRKGQVHCGYCHQPHAMSASSNPAALKFPRDPDRMCLQCHSKFTADLTAHTHHAASSEASRCVSCHMPRIMNSLLFKARTHRIDDIPNAEMTQRFGPEESPNACLLCHTEKDAQWAALRLQAW